MADLPKNISLTVVTRERKCEADVRWRCAEHDGLRVEVEARIRYAMVAVIARVG